MTISSTEDQRAVTSESRSAKWSPRIAWSALGVALVGLVAVGAASPRGFEFSDEGWALLASKSPKLFSDQATPTRFQFMTGDLYRLVGENVIWFRIGKILIITVAAALFAFALLRLLVHMGIAITRADRVLVAAIVVVSSYGANWLPQSPSYNDVALVAHLLFAGAIIGAALSLGRSIRMAGLLLGAAAGFVSWFAVMNKFSGSAALVVLAVAIPVASGWSGRPDVRKWAALVVSGLVGVVLGMLVWQVHYAPVGDTISGLLHSVRSSQQGDVHNSSNVFAKSAIELVFIAVYAWLAWNVARARTPRSRNLRLGILVLALLVSPVLLKGLLGNSPKINAAAALGIAVIVIAIAMLRPAGSSDEVGDETAGSGRSRRNVWILFGALATTPFLGAFGTAASITAVSAHECAIGALAGFVLLAGLRPEAPLLRTVYLGAAVGVLAVVGVALTWQYPYNQPSLRLATASVDSRSPLADVRIQADRAKAVNETLAALDATGDHRMMLAFFGMQGFTFATDSTAPGEIFETTERPGTTAVIRRACASSLPVYVASDQVRLPSWVLDAIDRYCHARYPAQSDPVVTVPRVDQYSGSGYSDDITVRRLQR
jgi:hypothetical protein